jgi:hypothetical protein
MLRRMNVLNLRATKVVQAFPYRVPTSRPLGITGPSVEEGSPPVLLKLCSERLISPFTSFFSDATIDGMTFANPSVASTGCGHASKATARSSGPSSSLPKAPTGRHRRGIASTRSRYASAGHGGGRDGSRARPARGRSRVRALLRLPARIADRRQKKPTPRLGSVNSDRQLEYLWGILCDETFWFQLVANESDLGLAVDGASTRAVISDPKGMFLFSMRYAHNPGATPDEVNVRINGAAEVPFSGAGLANAAAKLRLGTTYGTPNGLFSRFRMLEMCAFDRPLTNQEDAAIRQYMTTIAGI